MHSFEFSLGLVITIGNYLRHRKEVSKDVISMEFKRLFDSTRIGTVTIKNRIAMAPMATIGLCNPDGTITQRIIDYYTERAKGGVGLIITGGTKVENEIEKLSLARYTLPTISINPMRFLQTSIELTEAVHTYGAKIFIQLTAGFGRVGNPIRLDTKPVAPSAIPNYWDSAVTCRELTTEEVEEIVKAFGEAAKIVSTAGFDGIEIHAMHEGYLLDQFTVSIWNKRTDKYGGDLKGRLTFPIEILHAIKDKVGKEYPVQLRYSVKHYVKDWRKGGLPGEVFKEAARDVNEGLEAAKILEKEGYDAFNADAGSYDAWYWAHPPIYMSHGCYLDSIEKLKKVVTVPVIVAGRMDIPELAKKAVEEGKADMIALGRALLADPYWPTKVQDGIIEDIRPCTGCHDGCLGRSFENKPMCCTVNPATGRERLYELKPALKSKKVLIAGGGVAGMEAARIATIRGHKVTLYEKSKSLGGHLIEAGVPDFKKDIERLLSWYKAQLKKAGVDVIFNREVTTKLVESEKPDVVIVATGSTCILPKIKGVEKVNVVTCVDLLLEKRKAGDNIVVVGGGLVGCETALWLAKQGKKVTIVEILHDLMMSGLSVPHANRIMLLDLLALNNVEVMTNARIREIKNEEVVITNKFETKEIKCNTVALALGLKSEDKLYHSLKGKITHLYAIGDCKEPRRMLEAIWDGHVIASTI